jgi:AAA domain
MTDALPYATLIEPVARHLLGEPNRSLSTRTQLRWGTHGSLAVEISGPKAGTWHDHERGEGGGVLALIARETKRVNGEAVAWLREHGFIAAEAGPPKGSRKIVASYDYRDAAGALLFQVCRYHPKDFRQRRPDGKGGWSWNLQGIEPVLYRLPELLRAAAGAAVYVVEGEKDAEALRDRLLIATTCPGGAGKWRASYSEALRGRRVVILPDNDPAGEAHAQAIAEALHGIAASVRIVRLPGLPPKGDASDWLAAGGTVEELDALAAEAPELLQPAPAADDPLPGLRDFLAIEAWAERQMPPPDRLLGDLVTTTTRMFLVGRTGLGKTMLGLGMAVGMAAGTGFLHWRSARAARVLYIDGEMPGELIRARSIDALRRAGVPPAPGKLAIYSRDTEDDFGARFPTLGKMPPLNTEAGQNFVHALIGALGGVDVVIFDNVMSLIAGDQKDEVPWSDTLPLVSSLTARRIGQVWLDHTGHATDRQYGSSTKAWRFDAVGVMGALPDDQRHRGEVGFTLSFEHPGKARRRTPDNWQDFDTVTVRLADDRWTATAATRSTSAVKLSPAARQWHRALVDALAAGSTPGRTTRAAWYAEAARTGLAEPIEPHDDHNGRRTKQAAFRKYLVQLREAGLVGIDGEIVTDMRRPA